MLSSGAIRVFRIFVASSSVLVTGGTGFLGRRIVERLLREGRSVAILGRTPAPDLEQRGVRFIRASLDDAVSVRGACRGVEAVFHVAAKVGVWGRYEDFFRPNVLGTRAVLEGCREQLREVLEEWVLLRVHRNLALPAIDGIELAIKDVA